jgi:hypothetical protein
MPLSSKTISTDMRGLLFLFVHWFDESCCVEREGEIGEEVRSMGKVTRETHL